MKNLDDLVPPLDLCKRIPAGEFEDSVFVWWGACVYPRIKPGGGMHMDEIWHKRDTIPAPTLAEILERLPSHYKVRMKYPRDDKLVYSVFGGGIIESDMNAASAALKVWLKLNVKE